MSWGEFWTAVLPPLVTLILAVIGWAVNSAANQIKAKTGIEIEATHRDALKQAIETGVRATLRKFGPQVSQADLVADAQTYVSQSVPDAVLKLNPEPEVLRRLILSAEQKVRAEDKGPV